MDICLRGTHTFHGRKIPIAVVCWVLGCGLVVVFMSMNLLHMMCTVLSGMLVRAGGGRGGSSLCLGIIAIVLGYACPSLKCHS